MSRASTHPVQRKQRRIQSQQDSRDRQTGQQEESREPVQTSGRDYPADHPAQHLRSRASKPS